MVDNDLAFGLLEFLKPTLESDLPTLGAHLTCHMCVDRTVIVHHLQQ